MKRVVILGVMTCLAPALIEFVPSGAAWSSPANTGTARSSYASPDDLNTARWGHTATLLPNGKVLVVGGYKLIGNPTKSVELYDPADGSWSYTADMNVPRVFHTATLLAGGKLLVAGGNTSDDRLIFFGTTNTAELYDPETEKWSLTGNLTDATTGHTATVLENGKVLVAGGWNGESPLAKAEVYDPETGTWAITGNLVGARYWHTATLLKNNKVLVAGGSDDGDLASTLATAELYDPETRKWSRTGDLGVARVLHTATQLPSGEVLVAGGYDWPPVSLSVAEVFDPTTGAWNPTDQSKSAREGHTATLLQNGEVMIAGGYDWNRRSLARSVERYNPVAEEWIVNTNLGTARRLHTATLLQDGKVLIVGGDSLDSMPLKRVELYDPSVIDPLPKILSATVSGRKIFLVGENFDPGAVVLLNGVEQKTRNDELNPSRSLIARTARKKIKPGSKLQVRNPDGLVSEEFVFCLPRGPRSIIQSALLRAPGHQNKQRKLSMINAPC